MFRKKVLAIILIVSLTFGNLSLVFAESPVVPQVPTAPTLETTEVVPSAVPEVPQAPTLPIQSTKQDEQSVDAVSSDPTTSPIVDEEDEAQSSEIESLAADNNQGNESLSNESNNENSNNESINLPSGSSSSITNTNNGDVDNVINVTADSGNNSAKYNTGNGAVKSGDANILLSLLNLINTVFISPNNQGFGLFLKNIVGSLTGDILVDPNTNEAYSLTGSRLDASNTDTGANSENTASIETDNSLALINDNTATANNNINLTANTGGNSASYNTGDGSVSSGDADVSLNLMNMVNNTFVATANGLVGIINILGNFVGNIVLPKLFGINGATNTSINVSNNSTGAGSTNDASVESDSDTNIANENACNIANNLEIDANAGENKASYNTGDGSVQSGSSSSNVNVQNMANQSSYGDDLMLMYINVLGKWNGQNLLPYLTSTSTPGTNGGQTITVSNQQTGAGSENNASVEASNSVAVTNNNDANINNSININANTGNNSSSYNTGDGSVSSGDANVLANIFNFANLTLVGKRVVFFIVNIFGDWTGNVTDEAATSETGTNSNEIVTNTTTVTTSASTGTSRVRVSGFANGSSFEVAGAEKPNEESRVYATLGASDTGEISLTGVNQFIDSLYGNLRNLLILLATAVFVVSVMVYERHRKMVAG